MSLTKVGELDEHGLSASDVVIDTHNPLPVNVLPRPYSANPVGEGVTGVDNQRLNAGIAPRGGSDQGSGRGMGHIYDNELPAAPRNQLDIPFPMKGVRRTYKRVFKPNQCYIGYSKDQGVAAFTCGSGGVGEDGKVFRGNRFAAVYNKEGLGTGMGRDMDIVERGEAAEPKKQFDRPTVAEGQSLFYPYPSFGNRYYPLYKVYPDTTEYTQDGLPYYSDEYKALAGGRVDMGLRNTARGLKPDTEYGVKEADDIVENFGGIGGYGSTGGSSSDGTVVMIATLVIVGTALVLLRR